MRSCRLAVGVWQNSPPMKPRSIWTGHLKISLVTVPVRLFCALNEADKISFNQLHKGCHQRLKQQLICPVHGKVEREAVVKGYELEKDRFVVLDPSEIENLKLETTHAIELLQFVEPACLDRLMFDTPYFLGPDGPVSEEAFSVFREALKRSRRVGIGQFVLAGRERLIALSPLGKGFLLVTLRYPAEIRQAAAYFDSIAEKLVDPAQITLALQLIENKTAAFESGVFQDRYQAALLDVIKAKLNGSQPVLAPKTQVANVVSLVEALQQSVAQTTKVKALPQRGVKPAKRKTALAA